jgi:hypothetical protein
MWFLFKKLIAPSHAVRVGGVTHIAEENQTRQSASPQELAQTERRGQRPR